MNRFLPIAYRNLRYILNKATIFIIHFLFPAYMYIFPDYKIKIDSRCTYKYMLY